VENPEDKANSFMLEPSSKLQGRAGQFNAPTELFNPEPAPSLPPPEMPTYSSQSLKEALDKRKNWTLMTPEEILGVPTPEKILGLPDPTGDDQRTPEERFLRRQNLAASISATNALRRPDASIFRTDDNPFAPRDPREANDAFAKPDASPVAGSRKYFDRLVNASAGTPFGAEQNKDTAWASAFDQQPAPQLKPNLEQLAAMERFRAMMEPSTPPEKLPAETRFSSARVPVADPNLQPLPIFNPLGQSYPPLQSSINRPTGIMPLPGLTANPQSAPPKKPLVQLPPWLSKDPQPPDSPFGPINTRTW
jgi:hypothetical protein